MQRRLLLLPLLGCCANPAILRAQIVAIQRIPYGSPLIDSLPAIQFPRGGTYTAIIQGGGLAKVTAFSASNSNVSGVVISATDQRVTVQVSSTAIAENDTAHAPIPAVFFSLLTPSGSISSG